MTTKSLNGMRGADLVDLAKNGNDDAGSVILARYKKRLSKDGADHRQTRLLARWLGEILEARRGAEAPVTVEADAPATAPAVEADAPAPQTADDIVAAALAARAAAPPKRPVRRFAPDTVAMYRLVDEHGMTAGEVAEFLGKTEGTVRNAVTRVRKAVEAGDDIIWG